MKFLGIDPSQRNTGVCLRDGADFTFTTIKTGSMDVLSSARHIRREFRAFVKANGAEDAFLSIERQLSVGGQSSALMFHFQMNMLEMVKQLWGWRNPDLELCMPLPGQLRSYVYHKHGIPTSYKDGQIVAHFKETTGYKPRVSIHCVDGYYLTRLAEDVLKGEWKYKLPSKEAALIPWRIRND